MSTETSFRVAVDVGGTFIDFVLMDEATGHVRVEKIASLPEQLADQLVTGLNSFDVDAARMRQIFHGMTIGVNALVQEKGVKVGLITTRGFRDVLAMGRGGRKPAYDFVHKSPASIVPRYLCREVTERIDFKGEVVQPLDMQEVDREIAHLLSHGVQAISVAFLHAYANAAHERQVRDRIKALHPDLPVSLSHEIASVWREYERTSTTVLNSYIQPIVKKYLDALQGKLKAGRYLAPVAIMQSNGGVASPEAAAAKPIRSIMSGPAGGVIGAHFLCQRLNYRNVICTDVGGTTYDVAVIEEGRIVERAETQVAGRAIVGSLIDVTSIGAGGGSIAWLDHRNALQVGPRSAGASPGPACFGRGGVEATTTDAHLALGWLDPEYFLGGRMKLDSAAARSAIERVGNKLGLDVLATARGIVAIAENNMANALREKTVARGLDPREFVMLAYGGGGGLYACPVAAELGIPKVVVPRAAANFSAWGILTANYMEDEVLTRVMPFTAERIEEALSALRELGDRVATAIQRYGFPRSGVHILRRLDLRFAGQEFALTVDLDESWQDAASVIAGARELFCEEHRRLYGHGDVMAPMELVAIRSRGTAKVSPPELSNFSVPEQTDKPRNRAAHFSGLQGSVLTPIVQRDSLGAGVTLDGPAFIEEWTTTTVIPPGWRATVDTYGNLILEHAV